MFDPKKYDKTNVQNNTGTKINSFIEARNKIIEDLNLMKPAIIKECQDMENYIAKNPDSKAVSPFEEKLDGWSRILNGIEIVTRMYS